MILLVIALLLAGTGLIAADGDSTTIGQPVTGDQFLSGTTVTIDAAVIGDVFVAAETFEVNAPVTGDIIAFANTIVLNAPVSGKVLAFGGDITFNSSVLKVVAAGEDITFSSTATVAEDARIFGQTVINNGVIAGELKVIAETFTNNGEAGMITQNTEWEFDTGFVSFFQNVVRIIRLLLIVGYFLVGVVLVGLFRNRIAAAAEELLHGTLVDVAVGIGGFLVALFLGGFLAITIIGLPLALLLALLTALLLLVASTVASLAVGRKILELAKKDVSELWQFVLGFVLLRIVYWLPYIGGIAHILVVLTAFGALIMAARHNWGALTAEQ
jgi:hypothetical protein